MARYRFNSETLKRLRVASGKKPKAIALGIDRAKEAYIAYERGVAVPPTPVMLALCDLLGCEPADLVDAVDDDELHTAMVKSRAAQGLPPTTLPDDEV